MKKFIIGLIIGLVLGIFIPSSIFTKKNGKHIVTATQKYGKELGKVFK